MLQFHFQKHTLNHYNIHPPNILKMSTETDLHLSLLRHALSQARLSPPKPTNFRVGALLYSPSSNPQILTTGYTLESPGNTHAEQTCFLKLAATHSILPSSASSSESDGSVEDRLGPLLPSDTVLYTTMEPCNKRSAGNLTCVDRILRLRREIGDVAIKKVVCGVREPEKFVGENEGRKRLEEAGVEVVHVGGLEEEILEVATAGHVRD
jgi:pyrimidine deaminase RibD-like protein